MCLVSSEAHSINDGCFMISSQVLTNVDLRTGRFELDLQTNKGNRSDRANEQMMGTTKGSAVHCVK